MTISISAFYKFAPIARPSSLQAKLSDLGIAGGLTGTILIAREGINGTIAGTREAVVRCLALLREEPYLADLRTKDSLASHPPFQRWKVKVKDEILTFGAPEANPTERVGTYVAPKDWNGLISQTDVVVIDTRNTYEVAIGTFRGARNPRTRTFTEFKDFVALHLDPRRDTKIAMFCTGGIRCEKASSYLLAHGFQEVYHLEGGILKYLEEVRPIDSLWQGACFVFDERVAVGHGLKPAGYQLCARCGCPRPSVSQLCPQCPENGSQS